MGTAIALFRGINVGGKNILPMKDLMAILEELGMRTVRTYIQSGNAVFDAGSRDFPRLAADIAAAIRRRRGFEPRVLILSLADLEAALAGNPFPEAEAAPETLHLGFLSSVPTDPNLRKLDRLKASKEVYRLAGRVFYLHAPDGVGRSKLAAGAEKALGVPMTMRNWRTACEIRAMARG